MAERLLIHDAASDESVFQSKAQKLSLRIVSKYSFPKSARLLKRGQFKALSQRAFCFKGRVLCIFWKPNTRFMPRLGITVAKKYGDAVRRNRFKRHVREAFRLLCHSASHGIDLNVRPKEDSKAPFSFQDIYVDLESFLATVNLP